MRFDSIAKLVEFLQALVVMGYVVPFCDYKNDLASKGFTKHIHFYRWELIVNNDSLQLVATDKKAMYVIDMTKGLV